MSDTALVSVLRRDRAVVTGALVVIAGLAWTYLLLLAADMDMGGMDMTGMKMVPDGLAMLMAPAGEPWSLREAAFTFAMWMAMMIGMMTPSAAPVILIYARVGRQAASRGKPFAATGWFTGGYLLAWSGFSLAATGAQWALEQAGFLTAMLASASRLFSGVALVAAGLYQWTPLKNACLTQCQSPLAFIQRHGGFRRDAWSSMRLGLRHGAYCVGCCWALMALLFFGGVMNLLWIAAIAVFVLAEKVVPAGRLIARAAGAGFVAAGLWLFV